MKNYFKFLLTRIEADSGINSFLRELSLCNVFVLQNGIINKRLSIYKRENYTINYNEYISPVGFSVIEFLFNDTNIANQFVSSNYFHIKGLVDITDIEVYKDENIINGSIFKNRFIIEGVKGVGKTTLIEQVIPNGIICQDREMEVVSNDFYNNLPISVKSQKCFERMHRSEEEYLIVIKNTDVEALKKRIFFRNKMNKKDLITEQHKDYSRLGEYVKMYSMLEENMKINNLLDSKIDFIDCTGLDQVEQQKILLKCISEKK